MYVYQAENLKRGHYVDEKCLLDTSSILYLQYNFFCHSLYLCRVRMTMIVR